MPSERITLQLYLGEIVTLISEGIMSSSWATKKKACFFLFLSCSFLIQNVNQKLLPAFLLYFLYCWKIDSILEMYSFLFYIFMGLCRQHKQLVSLAKSLANHYLHIIMPCSPLLWRNFLGGCGRLAHLFELCCIFDSSCSLTNHGLLNNMLLPLRCKKMLVNTYGIVYTTSIGLWITKITE